jgi:hypothetical protein
VRRRESGRPGGRPPPGAGPGAPQHEASAPARPRGAAGPRGGRRAAVGRLRTEPPPTVTEAPARRGGSGVCGATPREVREARQPKRRGVLAQAPRTPANGACGGKWLARAGATLLTLSRRVEHVTAKWSLRNGKRAASGWSVGGPPRQGLHHALCATPTAPTRSTGTCPGRSSGGVVGDHRGDSYDYTRRGRVGSNRVGFHHPRRPRRPTPSLLR